MSLQGNLTDLPLEDLMQVFTLQHKCGILFIDHQQYRAEVCINKTVLHSALIYQENSATVLQGVDAILEILSWEAGEFHFEMENILPVPRNIFTTVDYIILEFYRRCDEEARSKKTIDLNAVPQLVPNPPVAVQINLELDEWRVLLQINGTDCVQKIAAKLAQPIESLQTILEDLRSKGLVDLAKPLPPVIETKQLYQPTMHIDPHNQGASYYIGQREAKLEISYHYRETNNQVDCVETLPTQRQYNFASDGNSLPIPVAAPYTVSNRVPTTPVMPSNIGPILQAKHAPKVKRGLLSGLVAIIKNL